jgi:hypothetical protein
MEASVRGINLVAVLGLMSELCRDKSYEYAASIASILRLLCLHGEFIWRTREFTDVPGNHYAANIAALAIIGAELRDHYPNANKWMRFAAANVSKQVRTQFLSDGVNFEKSLSYHRLVTTLFVLAVQVLESLEFHVDDGVKLQLRRACNYSAQCTRPDGRHPMVGDSDEATVLGWDGRDPSDPGPLHGLAAAYFQDPSLRTSDELPIEVPWLLGWDGLQAWKAMAAHPINWSYRASYPDGGAVVVRESGDYLWVDVGEVGMFGRGGHGHNDLTAFELWLDGHALLVDPGSYMYTGDAESRNLFRSTAYHNMLVVDGLEIAPLESMWRIGPEAEPVDVRVDFSGEETCIAAGHLGYQRLTDPVGYRRTLWFNSESGRLKVVDALECDGHHRVERFFHLADAVFAEVSGEGQVCLYSGKYEWVLEADGPAHIELITTWRSISYGRRKAALSVVVTNDVRGSAELTTEVRSTSRATTLPAAMGGPPHTI